jgi:hypothetical protein
MRPSRISVLKFSKSKSSAAINKLARMISQFTQKAPGILFFYLILFVNVTSCSFSENKTGYQVDHKTSMEIWRLSNEFCTSIMKYDYKQARSMLGEPLLAKYDTLELNRLFFSLQWSLMEFEYYAQNIYYQKNIFDGYWVRARFDDPEIKAFNIKYAPDTKETAITTALLENSNSKSVLTSIFGRYSGEWKINYFYSGWLALENKDAFDWVKEAKIWIRKKDYVMATYCIQVSYWLLEPAYGIWTYDNKSELLDVTQDLNRKIRRELRFKDIEEIETKPRILNLHPMLRFDTIYPGVTYFSRISFSDTNAILEECSMMDSIFADYYKNVDSRLLFVHIVDNDDQWSEEKNSIIMTRELLKPKKQEKKKPNVID